jgi:predicted enzyme related to lactoylglutathione lyase
MNMERSPVENRIGCVFIPVSNMRRAIEWYSWLLGQPVKSASHKGRIYDLPMEGGVRLILDSHKPVTNSSQPICFFWTGNIEKSRNFLRENNVEIINDIEDIGSVSTLIFKDPDGNLLMVCQRNA